MGFFEYVSPRGRGGGDGTIVFLGMGDDGSYGIERYDWAPEMLQTIDFFIHVHQLFIISKVILSKEV